MARDGFVGAIFEGIPDVCGKGPSLVPLDEYLGSFGSIKEKALPREPQ
jgi:hypothetical protein